MKLRFPTLTILAASGLLVSGCITHHSTTYIEADRTRVDFENDTAARLFYETLNKHWSGNRSESSTKVEIPFIFESEERTLPSRNKEFNDAVAACDTNHDGRITEQEARNFAGQY